MRHVAYRIEKYQLNVRRKQLRLCERSSRSDFQHNLRVYKSIF